MENNIKNYLFGRVIKAPVGKLSQLNEEKIKEVLNEGAVIASFCKSCGFVQGFSIDEAKRMAEAFDIDLPQLLDSLFFESNRCILCADDFSEVTIERYR